MKNYKINEVDHITFTYAEVVEPCRVLDSLKFLYFFKRNKTEYTAAKVADGWAGAENLEKNFVTDGPTDGPTDRRTDGPKSGL